jgi:hypothetical protein
MAERYLELYARAAELAAEADAVSTPARPG